MVEVSGIISYIMKCVSDLLWIDTLLLQQMTNFWGLLGVNNIMRTFRCASCYQLSVRIGWLRKNSLCDRLLVFTYQLILDRLIQLEISLWLTHRKKYRSPWSNINQPVESLTQHLLGLVPLTCLKHCHRQKTQKMIRVRKPRWSWLLTKTTQETHVTVRTQVKCVIKCVWGDTTPEGKTGWVKTESSIVWLVYTWTHKNSVSAKSLAWSGMTRHSCWWILQSVFYRAH